MNTALVYAQPQRRGFSRGVITVSMILSLLLIGSSGLIYYGAVIYPAQVHAHIVATATAQVRATTTAQAKATASFIAANPNPYPGGGTLVLLDPLRDNSKGYNWDENIGQKICHYSHFFAVRQTHKIAVNSGLHAQNERAKRRAF
jgi:hypothetical protein